MSASAERSYAIRLLSGLAGAALILFAALPQASANTAAAPFLDVIAGSRPAALSGAFVAVADDLFALGSNPAGLSQLRFPALAFQHNDWGLDMRQEYLGGGLPLGPGGLGLGLTYMSYGTISERDSTGVRTGHDFSPMDLALNVGYGWGEIVQNVALGAGAVLFQESLAGDSQIGAAVDLGGIYYWHPLGLQAALAIRHLGTPIASYNLPAKLSCGLSGRWLENSLLVSLQADAPLAAGAFQFAGGVEYRPIQLLAFRAGYRGVPSEAGDSLYGFTAGLGLQLDAWGFSYAYQPLGNLAQAHRLTLEYTFAPSMRKSGEAARSKPLLLPTPTPEIAVHPETGVQLQPSTPAIAQRQTGLELEPLAPAVPVRLTPATPEDKKTAIRHFLNGRAYHEQHQYDLAIDEYQQALALVPDFTKARQALAWARRDRAREQMQKVLKPESQRDALAEARKSYEEGRELERKGRLVDAAFSYKSALWTNPGFVDAQRALQRVQAKASTLRTSAPSPAMDMADKLKTAPAPRTLTQGEVLSSLQAQRHPRSAAENEDALGPGIQKHFLAGSQALDAGDYSTASREFELILEFQPENKQAQYKLNLARKRLAEEAQAARQKAVEAKTSGDKLEEIKALRNLVELEPNNAEVRKEFNDVKSSNTAEIDKLFKQGVTAYAQGHYTEAIQIWNEVLDLDSDHQKAKESIKKAREKIDLINE